MEAQDYNKERVIKALEKGIRITESVDGGWVHITIEEAKKALELLKEQEKSIPVSWLEEKLEGHPELPYTTTDGINYVLDLWEGR